MKQILSAVGLAIAGVFGCEALHAAPLYWDTNGTTAGTGSVSTGTWGSDSFWNSDATGGGGGSFTNSTTSSDLLTFAAAPSATSGNGAYTVTVSGTQSASGLVFLTSGVATVSGGTIQLGASGIDAQRDAYTTPSTVRRGAVIIDSNVSLQASQIFRSNGVASGNSNFTVNGNVSGTGNLTLQNNGGAGFTMAGTINNTGTLVNSGTNPAGVLISGNIGSNVTNLSTSTSSVLTLTGTNTYTGTTTLAGVTGTSAKIVAGSNNALSAATTVIMNSNASAATTATLSLGRAANSYNVTVGGLSTTGANLANNKITNESTGTGTATLTVNPDGLAVPASSTFGGVIQDGATAKVALTKAGSQSLTLTGANTYSGKTTVSGGTLILTTATTNNISASTAIEIASGATLNVSGVSGAGGFTLASGQTLQGAGTVTGALTVGSGATLAPGSSPGTLTFNNDLTLASGSTANFELNSFSSGFYDLAQGGAGSQAVFFNGTFNLAFQSGFNTVGSVKLFDFETYTGSFGLVNVTGLDPGYSASFDSLNGIVSVSAVPEPSTYALLGSGLATLWFLRRRGQTKGRTA